MLKAKIRDKETGQKLQNMLEERIWNETLKTKQQFKKLIANLLFKKLRIFCKYVYISGGF